MGERSIKMMYRKTYREKLSKKEKKKRVHSEGKGKVHIYIYYIPSSTKNTQESS